MRSRRGLTAVLAATLLIGFVAPVPVGATSRPDAVPVAKRLFMVSDSVGLGAIPAMTSAFAGWQVTVTGKPGLFTEMLVKYVSSAPSSAFGDDAIVATGYNYPYWDPPRFAHSVDLMLAALKARGVKRVHWVTMREVKPAYYSKWNTLTGPYRTLYLAYPTANEQLRAATRSHPELSIIDWASVTDRTGITYDAIHLNPTGAKLYASLAFHTVTAGVTRPAAGTVTEVPVVGHRGIPLNAEGVSLNVTVLDPRTAGFVAAYPCGTAVPAVGMLTTTASRTTANSAFVRVGANGKVCLFQSVAAHLQVDVNGYFPAGAGMTTIRTRRPLDTRSGGIPLSGAARVAPLGLSPGAPTAAFTAVVNLTTIARADGQVKVFTCGTPAPSVPTRRYHAGAVEHLALLVRTDSTGRVCVATSGGAHVIIDLNGWFAGGATIRGMGTRRALDTHANTALLPGVARVVQVGGVGGLPLTTIGVAATITVDAPADSGIVTAYPCGLGVAATTAVTVLPHHGATNSVMVGLDTAGRLCIRSSVATHVTVDLTGYATTAFVRLRPGRLLDTRA